jgi:hypothetical protein
VDISLNLQHPEHRQDEDLPCPRLDSCHIHDNSKDGLSISGGANCAVHECDIFDNAEHGEAVQVDPIKPTVKAPGTKRLKLKYDATLSKFAFKFNLRRYSTGSA